MDTRTLVDVGVPSLVVFLMGLVGLRLEIADFRRVLEGPRLVVAALLAQPLLLPPLAVAAGWLAGADPLSLVALVLIAACPAGVLSNAYTLVARGSGALSVTLTAMGTLLSAATLPPVAALGLALVRAEGDVQVPLSRTAADLVLTILLPVGLGMAARPAAIRWPRLERGLHAVATVATLALAALLLVTQWKTVTAELGRLSLAVVVFSAMAFVIGDRLARALGAGVGDRVAVALEFPGRNLGVAAVVGVQSLGRSEIAGLAAAVFVVQAPLLFVASGALGRARRRAAGTEEGRSGNG